MSPSNDLAAVEMNTPVPTLQPPTSTFPNSESVGDDIPDDDWEEWDGRSPFWMHCVAGSLAGVAEHTAVYPLDTVRTHIQVCASCIRNPKNMSKHAQSHNNKLPTGMWQTILYLTRQPSIAATTTATLPTTIARASHTATTLTTAESLATSAASSFNGYTRLWRGVQTILVGCIPAHALYFSSYESVKAATTDPVTGQVSAIGSSLAGAIAVVSHDLVLTPLDTVKQRMQLGYYQGGTTQAIAHIVRQEGLKALYRSFPVTLATNIPYGMVMVSTHEMCKQAWHSPDVPAWQTVLAASSAAGCLAATVTTPLDRIKTALQTQQLVPACHGSQPNCPVIASKHATWKEASLSIYKHEGVRGFFRGMLPRILSHTPAAAISWTTYETTKHYLLTHYDN